MKKKTKQKAIKGKILKYFDAIYGCDVVVYYAWGFEDFKKHWSRLEKQFKRETQYFEDLRDNGGAYTFGLRTKTNLVWISNEVPLATRGQYMVHELTHCALNMASWCSLSDITKDQEPFAYYLDSLYYNLTKQIKNKTNVTTKSKI